MDFVVIYEKTSTGYGTHCPDLPGCIAGGSRRWSMREDGTPKPEPTTVAETWEFDDGGALYSVFGTPRFEVEAVPPSLTQAST